MYFTFQFYHFAPTTTVMSYLVQPNPAQLQQPRAGSDHMPEGMAAPDPTTINATRILVTNHPTRKGAGATAKGLQKYSLALPGQGAVRLMAPLWSRP